MEGRGLMINAGAALVDDNGEDQYQSLEPSPIKKKVIFCTPSLEGPTAPYLEALEASIPLIIGAKWDEGYAQEIGCPYIFHARSKMTRRALDAGADVIVYLDYDISWRPEDLLKLISTDDPVVAGTYRFKKDEEEYMGTVFTDGKGRPIVRSGDGCIRADRVPAGFLKVTRDAVRHLMKSFPELLYGDPENYSIDLFQHGAHKGTWYGEDFAFSRRWREAGGEIWIVPDLSITHHNRKTGKEYPGNFHEYLMRRPGGCKEGK